ncbi:MAG: phosphoenolpyruvate synthase [Candidatus Pacearchaeota archaeon]
MTEKSGESKRDAEKIDFVKWFSELDKNSGSVAGGKGANLAEIYNAKVPVPPGFVVTAQAYSYFIRKSGLDKKIKDLLDTIKYEDTTNLDKITAEVRKLVEGAKFTKEMEDDILDAYDAFDTDEPNYKFGDISDLLKRTAEPIFVAVRSSATAEDLAEASFAGQQDSFVNIKGNNELLQHVKKCFASLFTSRATYYRHKKGFKHEEVKLAVVVQKMVDSDKSGVVFSKDPNQKNDNVVIEAVWGLGEGIVSGQITPDRYDVTPDSKIINKKISDKKIAITRDSGGEKKVANLKEEKSKAQVLEEREIRKLAEIALQLEAHYKKPQDIEFAIERDNIYIVQTRPITTMEKRIDMEAQSNREIKGEVILEGIAASPGIASGKIKIIKDMKDLSKIKEGDVLVTKMTNPDMVVTMQRSAAIVTDDGGLTAHAAIVSREMGIPAVVGTHTATTKLREGEIITVDGTTGKIYKGKVSENISKEILPVTAHTQTEIKIMVDLPSFASRAAKTRIKKTGLTRIEGIIAESGKHPNFFLERNKIKDYEDVIFKGIKGIAEFFDEIWVRTSDIRSDEFQNLEGAPKNKEANPMLGMHGIRYGIKNPEILYAELKALKKVSDQSGGKVKIGVMMPQLISVEELRTVKKALDEIKFNNAKVGVMIETPAAVQIIQDLCREGINFASFGTNDLTQYMLAIDRGNPSVQHLYNEMHPAILYQLAYVIRVCKKNHVESSICGQAGSKKEMVKFLVENGISSISVNADAAKEISDYVAEIEKIIVQGTDKEPRKYNPKEEQNENSGEEIVDELPPPISDDEEAQEKREGKKTSGEIIPEIKGIKKSSDEKRIEREIEAIEREKQEFLESEEGKKEELLNDDEEVEDENGERKDNVLDIF